MPTPPAFLTARLLSVRALTAAVAQDDLAGDLRRVERRLDARRPGVGIAEAQLHRPRLAPAMPTSTDATSGDEGTAGPVPGPS